MVGCEIVRPRPIWWFTLVLIPPLLAVAATLFQKPQEHLIEVRNDGFSPNAVELNVGDSVRFINTSEMPVWPASDPHPTHDGYPLFDPTEPLATGGSWWVSFPEEGAYLYHDHLAPSVTGLIVVGKAGFVDVLDKKECDALSNDSQKKMCMELLLKNVLEEKGLASGLEVFRGIASESDDCHQAAHLLGEYAYRVYAMKQGGTIGAEGTFCGYGFWHGFMTALAADSGVAKAETYCASISESTNQHTEQAKDACYHGIGIGLIPDPPPLSLWGKGPDLLAPVLSFCSALREGAQYKSTCTSGAFHAIVGYMAEARYGFAFSPDDPFALCRSYEANVAEQCYYQIASQLRELGGHNFARVVELTSDVPEQARPLVLFLASTIFINPDMSSGEMVSFLRECQSTIRGHNQCMEAIIKSLFDKGIPEHEFERPLAFCSSEELPSGERAACFKEFATYAAILYDPGMLQSVCDTVPSMYAHLCRDAA